jgi:hypothetical protein
MGDTAICGELQPEVEWCPPATDTSRVVDLFDGRTGWICCAVRQALFPDTAIESNSAEALELMRMLGVD